MIIMKKNKNNNIIPFSSITSVVKVRHISDESIARCNKNIVRSAKERSISPSLAIEKFFEG